MQRTILLLAVMAVIGLGCSAALADMMDVQVIGTPIPGDSWSQIFAFRAGEWETFNKLTFEITNYTFELYQPGPPIKGPSLGSFRDLETYTASLKKPEDIKSDTPDTSWALNSETSTKAVASGGGIGGKFNWLGLTAKFNEGDGPDNKQKLGFYIQLDLSDGSGYWSRSGNFWQTETGAYDLQVTEGTFTPIPAPAAIGLGLIGLGLVGWLKRRVA